MEQIVLCKQFKTNFMQKLNLSIFLAIILLIVGCKKTNTDVQSDIIDNTPITSQNAAKQVVYAETNLKKIGAEIALLSRDDDFVNFVRTQARKKFDQEYEVLVDDLKKNPTWSTKMNTKNLNEGLAAFRNIGGSNGGNYYPQIYIPTFQYNEDEGINNTSSLQADSIIYIFYGGNAEIDSATNTGDSYRGYYMDVNGELQYWGIVNEEYANTHEVWVFSLNEVVNTAGLLELPCYDENGMVIVCTGGGGTGGGGPVGGSSDPDNDPVESLRPTNQYVGDPTHYLVNCKIQDMIVRQHKENWLSGGSEIAIRAVLNCHNNRENGGPAPAANTQYKSDQASHRLGKLICQVTRKKVRNQTQFTANYSLQAGWPSRYRASDPIYFDYVIFERDLWPSPSQEYYKVMSGRNDLFWLSDPTIFTPTYNLLYRSANEWGSNSNSYGSPYAKSFLSSTNLVVTNQYQFYQSGLINNAAIGFNTVAY
jgi:hypothetical protein